MKEKEIKIKEMAYYFKYLIGQDSWTNELCSIQNKNDKTKTKICKKIKNIDLIDKKMLVIFWNKYSIFNIDIFCLWKEFKNISINNASFIKSKNYNDHSKWFLSLEISIFLERLIKIEKNLNFDQNYDFLDYERMQIQEIFNSLVNILDKLNLIPIQSKLANKNKERAVKISQKTNWSQFNEEDFQFLGQTKNDYFRNGFYKKWFNVKVDKINFYENYLTDTRNQITHYPILNHEVKNIEQANTILFCLANNRNLGSSMETNWEYLYFKQGIILATVYLFLVYEEMLKTNIQNIDLFD